MQLDASGGLIITGMQQQRLRLWGRLAGQCFAGFPQFVVIGQQAVLQGITGKGR